MTSRLGVDAQSVTLVPVCPEPRDFSHWRSAIVRHPGTVLARRRAGQQRRVRSEYFDLVGVEGQAARLCGSNATRGKSPSAQRSSSPTSFESYTSATVTSSQVSMAPALPPYRTSPLTKARTRASQPCSRTAFDNLRVLPPPIKSTSHASSSSALCPSKVVHVVTGRCDSARVDRRIPGWRVLVAAARAGPRSRWRDENAPLRIGQLSHGGGCIPERESSGGRPRTGPLRSESAGGRLRGDYVPPGNRGGRWRRVLEGRNPADRRLDDHGERTPRRSRPRAADSQGCGRRQLLASTDEQCSSSTTALARPATGTVSRIRV